MLVRPSQPLWMRRRTIWLASLFALSGPILWLVAQDWGCLCGCQSLENAYYIFTPSSMTGQDTLEEMKDLLSGLHARFIEIDAKEHDRVTSQISHFPHILASSLMKQTAVYAQEHEMARRFAAGGFSRYDSNCGKRAGYVDLYSLI